MRTAKLFLVGLALTGLVACAHARDQQAATRAVIPVSGRYAGQDGDQVTLVRSDNAAPVRVQIKPETRITYNGRVTPLRDIPQGTDVSVSLASGAGLPLAVTFAAESAVGGSGFGPELSGVPDTIPLGSTPDNGGRPHPAEMVAPGKP